MSVAVDVDIETSCVAERRSLISYVAVVFVVDFDGKWNAESCFVDFTVRVEFPTVK